MQYLDCASQYIFKCVASFTSFDYVFLIFMSSYCLLWIEFVGEICWCQEESQPLPQRLANGVIDLSTCLVNQKLHMVIIHNLMRTMLIGLVCAYLGHYSARIKDLKDRMLYLPLPFGKCRPRITVFILMNCITLVVSEICLSRIQDEL